MNDTQDSISQRDTGWMQLYCMNNQEVLDLTLIAYRAAEQLLIPCMVCFDGFRLSHTLMPVSVPTRKAPTFTCRLMFPSTSSIRKTRWASIPWS